MEEAETASSAEAELSRDRSRSSLGCWGHGVDVTARSMYLVGVHKLPCPRCTPALGALPNPETAKNLFSLGWLFAMVWPFLFLLQAFLLDAASFFLLFSSHSNFVFSQLSGHNVCRLWFITRDA